MINNSRIAVLLSATGIIGVVFIVWDCSRAPQLSPAILSPSIIDQHHSDINGTPDQSQTQEAVTPLSPEEDAARLVALVRKWRALTDKDASDQMAMMLKLEITDVNAGPIVQALPSELLETPFGLKALGRWAQVDRKAAVDWIAADSKATPFQIMTALNGWAESNPDAVSAYADSLSPGPWKDKVLTEVSGDAVRNSDPMEAITLLREMQPSQTQTDILKVACKVWAQDDPDSALAWVNKVTDPKLKTQLLGTVAVGSAYSDPQAAAEWAMKQMPSGDDLNNTMNQLMSVWVQESDASAAAQWVAQLPEGSTRQAALKGLLSQWRESDARTFAAWDNSLPTGSFRQEVSSQLANVDDMGLLR